MVERIINIFNEINLANKDQEFKVFRFVGFKLRGILFSSVAIIIIIGFIKFNFSDYSIVDCYVLTLRFITISILLLNLHKILKNKKLTARFLFVGVYTCVLFITALSIFRAGFNESYRVNMHFVLIIWFAFVPLPYKTLIYNGISFFCIYLLGSLCFTNQIITAKEVFDLTYFLMGTIMIGSGAAIINNKISYDLFAKTKEISKANLEIKESEEKYRTLVERANDGVVIIQDGFVRFINSMMATILGYEVDEMLNTPFLDYIAPEIRGDVLNLYKARQLGEQFSSIYDSILIGKDGKKRNVEFNAGLINYSGRTATLTYIRDIAERKKAEFELKESEKRFSIFMDSIPATVFIKDKDRKYLYANKFLKDIVDEQDLVGKTLEDISSGDLYNVLKDMEDRTYLSNMTEMADEFAYYHLDKYYLFQSNRFRLNQADGSILICGIDWNITEQKLALEELRKSNERLTFHINQTPLAYIEFDSEFRVRDWNPSAERIFGFKKQEAIGNYAFSLIVPDEITEQIDKLWLNITKRSGGTRSTNKNVTKDNKEIICQWYNTPLKDSEGKIIGVASLVEDVTERINLEKDLEKAVSILEKNYSDTKEQMQTYFSELQIKKNELLKLQKENLQSQFDMLKNQVNPHFLFNSLNVLSSLIKIEPDLAERFTEHLSKIYRYVLENKDKELVTLKTEMEFLSSYIFLLEIRFMDKINVKINIELKKMDKRILPLSLQILIENCIKHNIFSKKNPLQVSVFVDDDNNLCVINNYSKRENYIQSTGLGHANIESRYKFFTDKKVFFGLVDTEYVTKIPLL
jgi:PAS domain S-box-containing protein